MNESSRRGNIREKKMTRPDVNCSVIALLELGNTVCTPPEHDRKISQVSWDYVFVSIEKASSAHDLLLSGRHRYPNEFLQAWHWGRLPDISAELEVNVDFCNDKGVPSSHSLDED
jgi:hypothetical protein